MSFISQVDFATETDSDAFNAGRRALLNVLFPEEDSEDRGVWNARFNSLLPPSLLIQPSSRPAHFRQSYALLNNPVALVHSIATTADPTALVIDAELMKASTDGTGDAPAFGVGAGSFVDHSGALVGFQATLGHRPIRARRPRTGVRNRANGSAAPENNSFWVASASQNGVTATRLATGVNAQGPWAEYGVVGVASATSLIGVYGVASRTPAAPTQAWNMSFFAERVSGDAPPAECGVRAEIIEEIAPTTNNGGASSVPYAGSSRQEVAIPRTLSGVGTNQVFGEVKIRTASGATVDYVIRIQAVQFEQSAARTNYQFNYSQFDITEAGVPDVVGFAPDSIAQHMQLATAFQPAGDYTLIGAGVFARSATRNILGHATAPNGRFFVNAAGRVEVWGSDINNRAVSDPTVAADTMALIDARIGADAASAAQLAINGASAALSLSAGDVRPMAANGMNMLFRNGTTYGSPTFLPAVVAMKANVSDATRTALRRVLAARKGGTLA
jgi:hypothetical protein